MMWNWRVIVIVPLQSLAIAEAAARQINSTGDGYPGDAITTRLSPTGTEPPSHYACYTSATADMLDHMSEAMATIPGIMYWTHDVDGALIASNITEPELQAWGWQQALGVAGLEIIPSAMP